MYYSNSIYIGKSPIKKKKHKFLKIFFVVILLICVLSISLNRAILCHSSKGIANSGCIESMENMNFNIYAKGESKPTVVFLTGEAAQNSYTEFELLQSKVSSFARTITYDRPGLGFSDKSKSTRSIEQMLYETHEVLKKMGEKPPYILVAHSMAGMEALTFATKYPGEVQGIVFINSANPGYYIDRSYDRKVFSYYGKALLREMGIIRILEATGISHTLKDRQKLFNQDMKKIDSYFFYSNYCNSSFINYMKKYKDSARNMAPTSKSKEIPMVIITSKQMEETNPQFKEAQKHLLKWSLKSKQIIMDGGYNIHLENPDQVAEAIRNLIEHLEEN